VTKTKAQLGLEYLPNTPIYSALSKGPLLVEKKSVSILDIFICNEDGCSLPVASLSGAIEKLNPVIMKEA